MRILMLAQFYPPYLGGEERHVQDLSAELANRGHQVAVATLWRPDLPELELDGQVRVYRLRGSMQRLAWLFSDTSHRHVPPFPDPELVLALRRVVIQERPEIVHAHNWMIHSFLPLKAFSRARLVLSLHDYSLVCAKKKLVYQDQPCSGPGFPKCLGCAAGHYGLAKGVPTLLANWAAGIFERAAVDLFLPVSQATARGNGLVGSGLPFQVIPNFIPETRSPAELDLDPYLRQLPQEPFFLFVGALGRHKGVDGLLQAYAGLKSPPPLVLIGYETVEYALDLRDLPPGVHILKNWPHAAVMEAWRRSLAGVAPSTCPETFGIVVLEAFQNSHPVIAARIGGLAEVVTHGENGLLVPPGNPQALRQAMGLLLADPGLLAQMGRAARRSVARYGANAVVPQVEHVYRQLLEGNLRIKPGSLPDRTPSE